MEQSGSSSGSYPEGRGFKSHPRNQETRCKKGKFMDQKEIRLEIVEMLLSTGELLGFDATARNIYDFVEHNKIPSDECDEEDERKINIIYRCK